MRYIIESCQPDCSERSATCHSTCKRYKEARAKYEADKNTSKPNSVNCYFMSKSKKKRITHQQCAKKRSDYKSLKQLY